MLYKRQDRMFYFVCHMKTVAQNDYVQNITDIIYLLGKTHQIIFWEKNS